MSKCLPFFDWLRQTLCTTLINMAVHSVWRSIELLHADF